MEHWDFLEISEIDDIYEKPERRYSVNLSNLSEENNFGLSNIAIALSPHLSEDQASQENDAIKNLEKHIPSAYNRQKDFKLPIKIGTLTYEERQIKLKKYKEKKKKRV